MNDPGPFSDELTERIAHCFRVLSEPRRLQVLDALRPGSRNVQQITDQLETTQQNVSGHLAILHSAGIVERERRGREAHYSIVDSSIFELCDRLREMLSRKYTE